MKQKLIQSVNHEIARGKAKWGEVDKSPELLLIAATEELGEVAHAINHNEGCATIQQEIAEAVGILARLYDMVER